MIDFWEEYAEEESGKLMSKLLAQVELIDFYMSKIEFYLGKKQEEDDLSKKSVDGSPKDS